MNSRSNMIILLFVLIGSFVFMAMDINKEKSNNADVNTIQDEVTYENKESSDKLENKKEEDNKDIKIIKDYAKEKSLSNKENDKIKDIVEDFIIAYCSVSEDINPKTRLESVKHLIKYSLYKELNKVIDIETDLATEYYVYRDINKIIIHNVSRDKDKINVDVVVYSDYLDADLSTQAEDVSQDYMLTLEKDNDSWIIDSCIENFK
ncbi:hypothetical protein [Terrisporobacter muris]|uniref:Uncharacterized protein n=1 Tax=Terrisporobacter muris TaxID=2963284 RepID=A0A9X2M942_9FIRM|nr:hypothetical protein [Terrisporobacter muris]MCR1821876.1 hypothetical protein [Terrisporobacter muris]